MSVKRREYQAVIFDLDGTLLDALDDIADAANRVLARRGFPTHPLDHYRFFVGDGSKVLMTRALPQKERSPNNIHSCFEGFRAEYRQNWNVKTKPYAGVIKMLNQLAVKNVKLSVLSNKPHEFTRKCVAKFFSHWNFAMVCGQRESIPMKPDPQGALEIARLLGINPAEFLYLGDSAVDMQTALAAGMFPVGALWGFRSAEELQRSGAGILIENPTDLIDLIK